MSSEIPREVNLEKVANISITAGIRTDAATIVSDITIASGSFGLLLEILNNQTGSVILNAVFIAPIAFGLFIATLPEELFQED